MQTNQHLPPSYLGVLIITFLIGFDTTCIGLAISSIASDIGFTVKQGAWLSIGYTAGFSSFLLPSGILTDRLGATKIIFISLTVFVGTALLSIHSDNIDLFSLLRLLQGISAAFLNTAAMAILNDLFPINSSSHRDKAFRMWSAVLGVSFSLGPTLGGAIITFLSWKYIMLVNLPLGMIATYFIKAQGHINPTRSITLHRTSLLSTFPISLALLTLCMGNSVSAYTGYKLYIVIPFVLFIIITSIIIHIKIQGSITRMPELKSINFIIAMLLPVLFSIIFWSLFIVFPQFIYDVYGLETLYVLLIMLLLSLPISIAPFFTNLKKLLSKERLLPIGFSCIMFGLWLAAIGLYANRILYIF